MIFPGSFISANSAAAGYSFHIKISPEERMSFLAMSSVTNREIHSAHRVYLRRCDFQMSRIHTFFVSTKMVALKMFWNWSKEEFISKAVSILLVSVRHGIASISSAMTSGSPKPAARSSFDGNLLSKTRRERVKINTFHSHPHGSRETAMGAISL